MALDFPNSPTNGQTYGNYYFDSSVGTGGAWRAQPIPVGGLPAGSIIQWGSNTAPANWLICDGSAVSRTVYPSLFAAIGTQYGAGDGSTTFNLPDLRGRVAVGRNSGTFSTLGATGGAETQNISVNELPTSTVVYSGGSTYYVPITSGNSGNAYMAKVHSTGLNSQTAQNNLQPYVVTNYIIKATAGWTAGDSELATRVGVLEAAPAGLVRVVPTSVAAQSTGTATVNTTGVVTFTGVGGVSLNGCFTGNFRNYRIVASITGSATDIEMRFRLRASGTDLSAASPASYEGSWGQFEYVSGNRGQYNSSATKTNWNIGFINPPGQGNGTFIADLFAPATTEFKTMTSVTYGGNSTAGGSAMYNLVHRSFNQVSHDGFSIIPSTGNLTGTIQVYGYRN